MLKIYSTLGWVAQGRMNVLCVFSFNTLCFAHTNIFCFCHCLYLSLSADALPVTLSLPQFLGGFGQNVQLFYTNRPFSVVIIGGLISGLSRVAKMMSYANPSMDSGSRTARTLEFGRTYVVRPKGRHQATIVWLHGLGDNGLSWSQLLENLPLPNIKWICPTAPTRPVATLGGFPCSAWCDARELSEDGPDDCEGLDASVTHIANLLSTEPCDVKLGIGGFSMGAATALYSASCFAQGKYGNGSPYTINLRAIVGLSGWLPGSKSLTNMMWSHEAARRAASLPILLCHGICDDVVPYKYGEKSAHILCSAGFQNLTFKTYNGLGHFTIPKEVEDVGNWLSSGLGLDGSRS